VRLVDAGHSGSSTDHHVEAGRVGALHGVELGEQANRVWHGLSRALHHHAYELQPTVAEV